MSDQNLQARVVFRGEVQGVGFRYTTKTIAARHPAVTGTVRNLQDGSVEVIAEGPKDDISEFVDEVKVTMKSYISDISETYANLNRQHTSFNIIL